MIKIITIIDGLLIFSPGYHEIETNSIPILEMRQLTLGKKGPKVIQVGTVEAGIHTQIQERSTTSFIYSFDTFS